MKKYTIALVFCLLLIESSAQDSTAIVLDYYLHKSGSLALWQSTFSMETIGVSSVYDGGFTGDLPNRTRIFEKRVSRKGYRNSKDAYIENNIPKEDFVCVDDTSYQLVSLDPHGISSSFSVPIYEEDHIAKTSNARFTPQLKLLYSNDTLTSRQYEGIRNLGDDSYWLISFIKEKQKTTWYINVKSGLLERIEEGPGNYTTLSDYKDFQQRLMPCDMKIYQSGKLIYHETISSYRFNIELESCEIFLFKE